MEDTIMGRMISKQTYDHPAEYAQTLTRAQFEIRIKFRLFDDEGQDWANETVKAIMEEWGWCLGPQPEAVKVEQIPIIIGDTVHHRMVAVSLNFDTGWVDSTEIGEWWGEYIEDPDLWTEEGSPYHEVGEFTRLLESEVRRMAGSLQNVEVTVRDVQTCEDR